MKSGRKKGCIPWNKGKKHPSASEYCKNRKWSEDVKQKISEAKKGVSRSRESIEKQKHTIKHDGNPNWKGGTYQYWHKEAKRLFGKPCCENCGVDEKEYKKRTGRKLAMHNTLKPKDYTILESHAWKSLCFSCHMREEEA